MKPVVIPLGINTPINSELGNNLNSYIMSVLEANFAKRPTINHIKHINYK